MTIITEKSREAGLRFRRFRKRSCDRRQAFSLVEMLMAMTIGSIVLASILATFIGFSKRTQSLGAYTQMNNESRISLEILARDVRSAENVTVATASALSLVMPTAAPYNGHLIEYNYNSILDTFSRVERDSGGNVIDTRVLLDGVDIFSFSYYDPLGVGLPVATPSLLLSVKGIQIEAKLLRTISGLDATDFVISARFMMRNRPVTL